MVPRLSLTRREFLKLTGLTAAGMLAGPVFSARAQTHAYQARVIPESIDLFDGPSFGAKKISNQWKDSILSITEATISQDEGAFNRVWYELDGVGYAHSGGIQPVRIRLNDPPASMPENGALAEVTVPYTDAHWRIGRKQPVAYRYYYETTHWVVDLVYDTEGTAWYKVTDDKWEFFYYVIAEHLRNMPPKELEPISPEVPHRAKRIVVDTNLQAIIAYEDTVPVFMARAATGAIFRDGDFTTPPGRHYVYHKRPSRHMAAGNLAANGFDLPGVPWVSYFTERGVAFHGTYWHNNFGYPRSHGCVNLTSQASKWIYRWTLPTVPPKQQRVYKLNGTAVDVV